MKAFILSAAVVLSVSSAAWAQTRSVYTQMWSGKGCRLVEKNEEEAGWVRYLCKGPADYTYESIEGDLRQTLNVIDPSGNKTELNLWSDVSGYFSYAGPKIEWRVSDGRPVSLIVRFSVDKTSDTPRDRLSQLVVVRLAPGPVCVTDLVKMSPKQNSEARRLADTAAERACMFVK